MKNLFPLKNFGATLFSTIGGQEQIQGRRRALTEVDDLIASDMMTNEGRLLAESSPKSKPAPISPECDAVVNTRKREFKCNEKDFLQSLDGARRKMSLDLDYVEKVKSSDLKNILRQRMAGYMSNPNTDLGNVGARKEALGILPLKNLQVPHRKEEVAEMKEQDSLVMSEQYRNRFDSVTNIQCIKGQISPDMSPTLTPFVSL